MIGTLIPPAGSLQRRLGVGLAVGIVALWLAATLFVAGFLRHEIDEVFDSALQEVAQRILPLAYAEVLDRDEPTPSGSPAQHIPSIGPHEEYITYVVRDGAGRVLLQSTDAEPAAFPTGLAEGYSNGPAHRFYTIGAVRGTLWVTTAEVSRHRERAVARTVRMMLWPLAALIPIGLFGVWFAVRLTFAPVRAFRHEIESRGRGNLAPVETVGLPAEFVPLASAVDGLIARLRGALEAERSFTANSAHELRTPIAAALAQAQRLMAELPDGAPRERARSVASALRRLARLSEKLLQLAKAEGGGGLAETPQDLARVLTLVVADVGRSADLDDELRLDLPADGAFSSVMDADAFAILARNLIENAVKHRRPDTIVDVRLAADGRFTVTNDCDPVPPETLARLRRPFERGATEADGSGLGLAIAEAIAGGAGTTLELASPVPGRPDGFRASVALPRADAPRLA